VPADEVLPPAPTFASVFEELASGAPREATVRAAFDAIFSGAWTPVQVAGFAVALRVLGETPAVITCAAQAMRDVMVSVDHGLGRVVDTCGTGGDGLGTLNVSTAAAFVVAASGEHVAKHGNRSVSSRAGSADVLEALGVPLDVAPHRQASVLREAGIAFLFAPAHHPAMRHCGLARRELAIRTVFNALGPLANPARATHQVIGAYADNLRPILAEALRAMGVRRAWIVRGEDGLDELSPFTATRVTELGDGGAIEERTLTPEDFGFRRSPKGALDGGDARENAARIARILKGEEDPARDAIALNAAAAIAVATERTHREALREAGARALEILASGAAARSLDSLKSAAARAKEST
jgi:anthranilate phosphoribosyltransferase